MSTTRDIKLGNLEKIRREIAHLEANAAMALITINTKAMVFKDEYHRIDSTAIKHAANTLDCAVTDLQKAKRAYDELHEELYG